MRWAFICIMVALLLAVSQPAAAVGSENETDILRAGFDRARPLNDLGASKEAYIIGKSAKQAFNLSQRLGRVGRFSYNTSIFRPIFELPDYREARPAYEPPANLSSRPVYRISGYPAIKMPAGIP
ncbi:MAG: hypothetical protein QUS08_07180 [Methanothrix sp.]|nr:hypothetical protein [Methanothrix sp.]